MRVARIVSAAARAFCLVLFVSAYARGQSTLVFLVRHAERAAQPAADPGLTPEGEVRARALAEMLASSGVTRVISTQFVRTLTTAKAVADKLGAGIDTIATGADVPAHAQAVAAAVRKYAGKAVLVVGHSNTIPAIAAALGAPKMPDLCDGDYDQIFVLEIPASGPARFMRSHFGAPAADPKCATMKH